MTVRPPAIALVVLVAGLGALLVVSTPWTTQAEPVSGRTPASVAPYFTSEQHARENAFHRAIRPFGFASLAIGLAVAIGLGTTRLGARLIGVVARPLGGGWVWQVILGSVALAVLGRIAVLPFDIVSERVLRRYGLSTQDWPGWALDQAKTLGLSLGIGFVALLAFYALVRAAPRTWWAWTALASAALVVLLSYVWPLLVEPVFNRFTPMQPGPLKSSLVDLAARDDVPVRDVLVADASRRTTTLNAYVSGFGSTRRIVVYDNLVKEARPEEVRLVVAHELAHAKHDDVLYGTLLGALGLAAACCAVYLVLSWPPIVRRAGASSPADPRSLALLSALIAVGGLLAAPVQNLVSRRIEARADVHSLDLTRDPAEFIAMQRRLSVTNLSDLDPNSVVYGLFFSHPTGPERIALARDWEKLHR